MKRRDLNLEKYNISKDRFRELYYFCLQYDDRKTQLNSLYGLHATAQDGQPHGSGISDPTARDGAIAAVLSRDNEIMEQSALEASGDLYQWILEAVKYDLKFEYLRMSRGMPCSYNEFKQARRKFYYVLDKKKSQI